MDHIKKIEDAAQKYASAYAALAVLEEKQSKLEDAVQKWHALQAAIRAGVGSAHPQPAAQAREPMTHEQAKALVLLHGYDPLKLVFETERAHGIAAQGDSDD